MTEEVFPSACARCLWCTQTMESKRAIAGRLDVYVQDATNGTPCGCARLGSLHDRRGVPFSMCPLFVVHSDDGLVVHSDDGI